MSHQLRAVSLFSGCGGFCEGVALAGFRVVAAVENDRFAAETYRHNFPGTPLFEDSVERFRMPGDPVWETEKSRFAELEEGEIDLVFGGPPCQGYSQIGPRDLEDPRNVLYREFVRILEEIKPKAFLMENVPNMLMLAKGTFGNQALAALRAAGYSNAGVRVLAATDFGVPQLRRRALFFGTRDDLEMEDGADWIDFVTEQETTSGANVWQAIGDLPEQVSGDDSPLPYPRRTPRPKPIRTEMRLDMEGSYYSAEEKLARAGGELKLFNHHTKDIQERRRDLIALLKPGRKADSLPVEVWNGARPEKWRRLHPEKPAHTILAQMHRDLSEWVHPRHQRWITVREAARLQSFHDGFVFKSSEWQMLKQIGNAVPPLMGRAMAMVARRALEAAAEENRDQPEVSRPLSLPLAA